jgi:hypothetical protein
MLLTVARPRMGRVSWTLPVPPCGSSDSRRAFQFDAAGDEFVSGLDPAGFAEVSVADVKAFDFPEGSKLAHNQAVVNVAFGAQESRTAVALFNVADGTAAVGLQLIEYDNACYAWDLFGGILGTDSRAMTPMTTDKYDDMVSGIESRAGDA